MAPIEKVLSALWQVIDYNDEKIFIDWCRKHLIAYTQNLKELEIEELNSQKKESTQ